MSTEIDRLIERLKVDVEEANFLVRAIVKLCAAKGVDVQAITGKSAQAMADRGVSEISADILEAVSTLELLKPMLAERDALQSALAETHNERADLLAERERLLADRDEWRTQHENLLGIYREQTRTLFRRTEMLRRTLAYLPRTLGITRDIHEELPPANETTDEIHAIDSALTQTGEQQ